MKTLKILDLFSSYVYSCYSWGTASIIWPEIRLQNETFLYVLYSRKRLTLLTLTAEAALFAIDTVIGDVSINPILLKATRAFWSLGVTLVEPFCCNDVDNWRSPLGIPGCPGDPELSGTVGSRFFFL